jgi:hypothetical protein
VTFVLLGNTAPVNSDGSPALDPEGNPVGNTITQVTMRPGWDDEEEAALALSTDNDPVLAQINDFLSIDRVKIGVLEIVDLWQYHAVPGDLPEWVESDDGDLADALSQWFSIRGHECTVGRPGGWDDSMSPSVAEGLPPIGGGALGTSYTPEEFGEEFLSRWREHNLLVNAGRDAMHKQHLDTAAQPAAFNFMAVCGNAVAASATNTTGAQIGEITTAGGGLLRKQVTFGHTNGTNTSTLTGTYTANGSDALPVTIGKIGVFNAVTVGTLGYETLLGTAATLSLSGDNCALTHTITAG